jgi:uncharacterized membrane protein YbhN (UPF0104 family)
MNRRRLLQTSILVVGLVGVAVTVAQTVGDAQDQVLPTPGALAGAAGLAVVGIAAAGRAWAALLTDTIDQRHDRLRVAGTFYTSQLVKYLPAGGVVQAASQVSMASAIGVPLGQVAVAFPVSALSTVAAGGTLSAGLVLEGALPAWARALALVGLASPALLHRHLLAAVLHLARRVVPRIPPADRLPGQRSIFACYGWALVNLGAFAAAYTVLLGSRPAGVSAASVFSAYALSWIVGFVAVPIPAGVGVREAVLVATIPGVGTASLLTASLSLRLVSMGAELAALIGNRLWSRRRTSLETRTPPTGEIVRR